MDTMNKVVRLGTIDTGNGRYASIYCKIQIQDGELSISGVEGPLASGNALGSCGQIVMHLEPKDINYAPGWTQSKAHRFLELWDQWHLNYMRAGCSHQRERGEAEINKPCAICGYRYGSAWLKEDLPEHVFTFMNNLPKADKNPAWI